MPSLWEALVLSWVVSRLKFFRNSSPETPSGRAPAVRLRTFHQGVVNFTQRPRRPFPADVLTEEECTDEDGERSELPA